MNNVVSRCQKIIDERGDKYRLKKTLLAINTSYSDEETGIVVGQCKALIESLCKSILAEKLIVYEAGISLGKLAKKAAVALGVEKTGNQDQKTREAFIKLINGFTSQFDNAANAIGTLRNEYCPLAHGRSSEQPQLHLLYAQFIAAQTDSIVSFLLDLLEHHKNFVPEIVFRENEEFNDYLSDEFGQIDIYGDSYQAPEILFHLNPDVYRTALEEYSEGVPNDQ